MDEIKVINTQFNLDNLKYQYEVIYASDVKFEASLESSIQE